MAFASNELIEGALVQIEQEQSDLKEKVLALNHELKILEKCINEKDLDIRDVSLSVRPSFMEGILVYMSVMSFKDSTPIIEALMEEGLEPGITEDWAEIERRTFYVGQHIKIMCFPKEGAVCRKVETGETTPVYRLECE